jgi:predicted transcriptional regulator
MKLTQPTDFEILEMLDDHGRNVAANLAIHLDRDRAYLNTRLPYLLDYGLVEKIGPSDKSGLYEITDHGRAALECREQYDDVSSHEFTQLIRQVTAQPSTSDR